MDSGNQRVDEERSNKAFSLWPSRFLGPMPGLKEVNLACWCLAGAIFLTRFCLPVWLQVRAGTISIPLQPNDFVYFYGIGHIVKDYPAASLYDYSLQQKTFNAIYSAPNYVYGPSPYPPFVGIFFSLFARVSFRLAFFLWTACSVILYVVGISAAAKGMFPGREIKASLIRCFSLAFYPFFWGIFVNGQLSAIAVCAVGIAIYQERHSRLFWSGLALSTLSYKPTLLLLLVPMLFLTRKFRTLAGFVSGIGALVLVSTCFGGIQIWTIYARFLAMFGRVAGLEGQRTVQLWKFIDIGSCLQAIGGARNGMGMFFLVPVVTVVVAGLAVLLWRSARSGGPAQTLAWAATLTWTLLINVYVPMYDSVLVAVAVVLTLGAIDEMHWNAAMRWMALLSIAIFSTSWVTYPIAMNHGIQVLSIALAVLGSAQLYLLYRSNRASFIAAA
jgi:Glycosyltransferase family 87